MFFKKTNNIVLLILSIGMVSIAFLLLYSMRNFLVTSNVSSVPSLFYALVLVLILLSVVFYFYVSKKINSLQEEIDEFTKEKKNLATKTEEEVKENKEEETEKEKKAKQTDIQSILKRLLPSKFSDIEMYSEEVLSNIASEFSVGQGVFYVKDEKSQTFSPKGSYAYYSNTAPPEFKEGESLTGQVVKNRKTLQIKEIPEGYVNILSGLGESTPRTLLLLPLVHDDNSMGIIELASFNEFDQEQIRILEEMAKSIVDTINKKVKSSVKSNEDKK